HEERRGRTPAARGAHRCPRRPGRPSTNNQPKRSDTLQGKGFPENGGSRKGNCVESGYVTLEQVAAHAGVSLATAAQVINGSTRQVSQRLRDKVNASARELGYLANASAQTLARNSSYQIGRAHV